MKKNILLLSILIPNYALAAGFTLKSFVDKMVDIINSIIPILITLAIVLFFYHSGMGVFGTRSGDATSQKKLKETLLWGIGIIFVMVSIWGILNLITTSLDLNTIR